LEKPMRYDFLTTTRAGHDLVENQTTTKTTCILHILSLSLSL
jgi:hypothetical protein